MAKHRVDMRFPQRPIDLGNGDVSLEVYADEQKLGELGLSRGGITWWARDAKKPTRNLTWEQFRDLMEADGQ